MCRRPEANWSQELSVQFQLVNFQGPGASTLSERSSLFWQFSASGHQFVHGFLWLSTDEEVSRSNISVPRASFINVSASLPGRMVHTCCVLAGGGKTSGGFHSSQRYVRNYMGEVWGAKEGAVPCVCASVFWDHLSPHLKR